VAPKLHTDVSQQEAHCKGTVKVSVPHSKKDPAVEGPQPARQLLRHGIVGSQSLREIVSGTDPLPSHYDKWGVSEGDCKIHLQSSWGRQIRRSA
jgi:hypothetical protein